MRNDDTEPLGMAEATLRGIRSRADNIGVVVDFQRKLKSPPPDQLLYNVDLEQALLGALLADNAAFEILSPIISSEHFYEPLHVDIFAVCAKLIAAGKQATPVTLRTFYEGSQPLSDGTTVPVYLATIGRRSLSSNVLKDYADTLRELSARRATIVALEDAAASAKNPDPDLPVATIFDNLSVSVDRLRTLADPHAGFGNLQSADDAVPTLASAYVLKGVLSRMDVAAVFGPTGAGKTFFALDFTWHVAQGKAWRGRRVTKCPVLYLPLEGRASFPNRLRAMKLTHGDTGGLFAWMDAPINLSRGAAGNASEAAIIRAAKEHAQRCGVAVGLIVIDTLARAMGGDSENDADSVAAVMARIDRIQRATGACVLLVCHPGKDAAKGLRGSYALPAALDVVIRVDRDSKAAERTVTLEKVRDGEEGPLDAFTLKSVHLGEDEDGDPVASCVLVPTIGVSIPVKAGPKPNSPAALALEEINQLILSGRGRRVSDERIPDNKLCVDLAEWRTACKRKRLTPSEDPEAQKKAFQRAFKELREAHLIEVLDDHIWLLDRRSGGTSICSPETLENSIE